MRGTFGCAIAGVVLLFVLYFLFLFVAMIEPGFAILILVAGIFVSAGVIVAFVMGIVDLVRARRRDERD